MKNLVKGIMVFIIASTTFVGGVGYVLNHETDSDSAYTINIDEDKCLANKWINNEYNYETNSYVIRFNESTEDYIVFGVYAPDENGTLRMEHNPTVYRAYGRIYN